MSLSLQQGVRAAKMGSDTANKLRLEIKYTLVIVESPPLPSPSVPYGDRCLSSAVSGNSTHQCTSPSAWGLLTKGAHFLWHHEDFSLP